MLPSYLDLTTMTWVMYLIIFVSILVAFMIIKTGEKPMLRVVSVAIIGVVIVFSYVHVRQFNECKVTGNTCTFLSAEVPQDDGFIN